MLTKEEQFNYRIMSLDPAKIYLFQDDRRHGTQKGPTYIWGWGLYYVLNKEDPFRFQYIYGTGATPGSTSTPRDRLSSGDPQAETYVMELLYSPMQIIQHLEDKPILDIDFRHLLICNILDPKFKSKLKELVSYCANQRTTIPL